jgi:hypothetical protein
MQLLMWRAIQEAKKDSFMEYDMGRSDWDHEGLLAFKDRWGCTRSTIQNLRYTSSEPARQSSGLSIRIPYRFFNWAPDCFLTAAGNIMYRHIA